MTPSQCSAIRIEVFPVGCWKHVTLLGEPVGVNLHRTIQGRSLPCFWPRACPLCGDPPSGDEGNAMVVAARLGDETAQLVYADWCDENYMSERAAKIRMGLWDSRPVGVFLQHYAPAEIFNLEGVIGEDPFLAVAALGRDLGSFGSSPYRGKCYVVSRQRTGHAARLQVERARSPLSSAPTQTFDVKAILLSLWFPRQVSKGGEA